MSKLFSDALQCPKCHLQFCTNTGDPRILRCGHCLCTNCLMAWNFDHPIQCNECQSIVFYSQIEDLPIATTIKSFVTILRGRLSPENHPKTFIDISFSSSHESNNDALASLGTCSIHSSPLHFGCLECEEWLCGTCVCLNHSNSNKKCKVVLIHEAIQNKNDELKSYLEEFETSREVIKKEVKDSLVNSEELIGFITAHVSLDEKYLKELNTKQTALILKEKHLNKFDKMVYDLEERLNVSDSPEKIKKTFEVYFGNKKIRNKNYKNQLFSAWTHWVKESVNLLENVNKICIRWSDWKEKKYFLFLSAKSGEVLMTIKLDRGQTFSPIFEPSFFTFSSNVSHPFIKMTHQSTKHSYPRISFIVDDSPLAQEFIKSCCVTYGHSSFRYTKASCPFSESSTLLFGDRERKDSQIIIEIDDRYLKPIKNGAVGVYLNSGSEHEIDINNMNVYIHIVPVESPLPSNLPYVCYGEEPKLTGCFGSVFSGLDIIEGIHLNEINSEFFISDCGVIVDYMTEDSDNQ